MACRYPETGWSDADLDAPWTRPWWPAALCASSCGDGSCSCLSHDPDIDIGVCSADSAACVDSFLPPMIGWCRGPSLPGQTKPMVEGKGMDFVDAESTCASYCLTEADCVGYAYRGTAAAYAHRCFVYGPRLGDGLPAFGGDEMSEWHAVQEDGL
eukprot:COSAG04_NODE_11367_length_713_cov_1.247557_2_plen_154_part_01